MFVYAHKNGGPKRNSIGGIDAEFIKIDKRQDKRKLMNMLSTKKIGGFTFKFNQYTSFFNEANFLLHKALSRSILSKTKDDKVLILDCMCGIGPFILPMLKKCHPNKNLKLRANDWNPDAIKCLKTNLEVNTLNRVARFSPMDIFCEDAKDFLVREVNNDQFDKKWIVMGGTPGVTEVEFLPQLLDMKVPLILTITGKKMDFIYNWVKENEESGRISIHEPLKPIWIRSGSLTAVTMTFL